MLQETAGTDYSVHSTLPAAGWHFRACQLQLLTQEHSRRTYSRGCKHSHHWLNAVEIHLEITFNGGYHDLDTLVAAPSSLKAGITSLKDTKFSVLRKVTHGMDITTLHFPEYTWVQCLAHSRYSAMSTPLNGNSDVKFEN